MLKHVSLVAFALLVLLSCKSSQPGAKNNTAEQRPVTDYGINENFDHAKPDASDTGLVFSTGDFDQFMASAKKEGKPHWVYFYADWCKPCKRMSAYTFSDERITSLSNGKFLALKIDVDQFSGMDIADRYQLKEYPVMLLFNSKGELVEKLSGFYAPDSFLEKLQKAL
jgi:thiol:disulfide interchange protein